MKQAVPTVHLNGTSKGELLRQLQEAGHAVLLARDAVCQAAPNARDYYVQPEDGAYNRARDEHYARIQRLQSVYDELSEIADQIQTQGRR